MFNNKYIEEKKDEVDYAKFLMDIGAIFFPEKCKCGRSTFKVEFDANSKTSMVTIRCQYYKCRNRIPIRNNSFYANFPKVRLNILTEVLKCFLVYELNAEKAHEYITETIKESINIETIRKIYNSIRDVIKRYLFIEYESEILGEKDKHDIFAVDESLFSHTSSGDQAWVLGIISNYTKSFRLEVTKERNSAILKKFITKFVEPGNKIITDGWSGYSFLSDEPGYLWDVHNHGAGDFGLGINTTSYIESLWQEIKSKIKHTYYIIPSKNFMSYLREAEFKIKNKNKSSDEKLKEFFSCFKCINDTKDIIVFKNDFMDDSDFD